MTWRATSGGPYADGGADEAAREGGVVGARQVQAAGGLHSSIFGST